ncbi:ABC transporter ATP-binding protein [Clostridium beijerinckii]|jgi:ABC-type antimicrobial peptide transport system, ATPase component|uniref:ABC transport system ATP-binding protein n=2 Tax=Clostridium beijerinckii TaxID=1520 RepID=A0A1S8NW14_CLOBE|nr:ABC transporter ATP-binding protein [Clostridium beijerinckii]ABR35802.1 AAA ATPase [Clostridium beijerinckii NCIMB 8052]AIU04068.1 AAA ATPase [Clostridium beijerinckii ATCC 35702]MBA8933730.1 putative ABC transport system ATP-binding protein [Clostridium beijerinckii]MBF7809561.1 ABC transporter ATP-binding protein [Clostridium beijerinckii]NOW90091.1 putative ABC transport system ATP-binding protein [Clostridium beijerinckii]
MNIIELRDIKKIYGSGSAETVALKNINLSIKKGEMIAIMGPSGCGKSTLLNIMGGIDVPNNGTYFLNGQEINKVNFNKLAKIRNKNISFIFQEFALLKEFSVLDNVILPLNFRKITSKEKKLTALKYLEKLQIQDLANKKVMNLSGGQQQRVAIARSLIQESELILADEPTGALDQENGENIMNILKKLNKDEGKTIIIVTHDINIAKYCDKIINMRDGVII